MLHYCFVDISSTPNGIFTMNCARTLNDISAFPGASDLCVVNKSHSTRYTVDELHTLGNISSSTCHIAFPLRLYRWSFHDVAFIPHSGNSVVLMIEILNRH